MTVWLTVADAAEYVKVSPDIIHAAVKAGDLPAYPVGKGREYRLDAAEVDSWLRSRAWEPKATA
jgi:excisionase family DNA binding protein